MLYFLSYPGPHAQLGLGRDGTFYIIAAGRCNHAGKGNWKGVTDGNGFFIGIEAEIQVDTRIRPAPKTHLLTLGPMCNWMQTAGALPQFWPISARQRKCAAGTGNMLCLRVGSPTRTRSTWVNSARR